MVTDAENSSTLTVTSAERDAIQGNRRQRHKALVQREGNYRNNYLSPTCDERQFIFHGKY